VGSVTWQSSSHVKASYMICFREKNASAVTLCCTLYESTTDRGYSLTLPLSCHGIQSHSLRRIAFLLDGGLILISYIEPSLLCVDNCAITNTLEALILIPYFSLYKFHPIVFLYILRLYHDFNYGGPGVDHLGDVPTDPFSY
jgi:hypothetical protein